MTRVLWLATLVILGQAHDPVLQVRAVTKDGQTLVGTPSIASLQIESSLGTTEIKLKDLLKVVFEGDSASVVSQDRSTLKGKLKLEAVKLTGLAGEVSLKPALLKEFSIQYSHPNFPYPSFGAEKENIVLSVRTKDGNDLVGSTDLSSIGIESTLGKFEIDIRHVTTFTKGTTPPSLGLMDGSELKGAVTVPEFKVRSKFGEFAIKPDAFVAFSFREVRRPPPGPPQGASGKPAPAASEPPSQPAIPSAGKAAVHMVVGDLRISSDGRKLFAVNLSDGKLCRWKLPGLEDDGTLALSGVEKAIALDPRGARIVAAGQKTVTLIGADTLTHQKSFSVEVDLDDVAVIDSDTLLGTGPQGIVLISIPKTAVIQKLRGGGPKLSISPKGDRAYIGELVVGIVREAPSRVRLDELGLNFGSISHGSDLVISPDGRYGCNPLEARIYRLGRTWAAAKVQHVEVERHTVAAFSADNLKLFLFTEGGFLNVYDAQDFKIQGSHNLGVRVTQATVTPDGASILVAGSAVTEQTGRRPRHPAENVGVVTDLYRFEIPKQ